MKSKKSPGIVYLKILMNFIQISGLLTNFSDTFSEKIPAYFKIQDIPSDPNHFLVGFECRFNLAFREYNIFFKKIIFVCLMSVFTPLILLFVCFLIKIRYNSRLIHLWSISFFVVFKNLQAGIVNLFISALSCLKIESKYYLANYPEEECWSSSHNTLLMFALPCLSLWMLLIPTFIVFKIRQKLNQGKDIGPFSIFTYGYKNIFFYWDWIIMLEKYTIIFITIFTPDPILAQILCLKIIFIFTSFQVAYQPYFLALFNKLVLFGKISLIIFLSCSITLSTGDYQSLITMLILFIMVCAKLLFVITWLFFHLKGSPRFVKLWNRCCFLSILRCSIFIFENNSRSYTESQRIEEKENKAKTSELPVIEKEEILIEIKKTSDNSLRNIQRRRDKYDDKLDILDEIKCYPIKELFPHSYKYRFEQESEDSNGNNIPSLNKINLLEKEE